MNKEKQVIEYINLINKIEDLTKLDIKDEYILIIINYEINKWRDGGK